MWIVVASIVIILTAAVTVAVIGVQALSRNRARQNGEWLTVARALNLTFDPETFTSRARLSGTVEGIGVEVASLVESNGKSSSRYTRYRVFYPPLGLGFKAKATGGWQKVSAWLGAQDIETGDAEFDPAVTVKGDDEAAVQLFLTSSRRVSVHRIIADFGGISVDDASMTWKAGGLEKSGQRLTVVIRRMVGVAQRLARQPVEADRAMTVRAEGKPAEASEILAGGSLGLEDRIDLAEASYAGGRYAEAAEALSSLEAALPADEQVAAWRRRADQRTASPTVPALPVGDVITDPGEVTEDLFDAGALSYEASRRFEVGYEGRRVRWSGTVIRSSAYRSDLEFGDGPGVRAVVRVYRLGWDLYGGRDVDAVIAFPEGADVPVGAEIEFEGILVRADSLMRNLFVDEGRLVG